MIVYGFIPYLSRTKYRSLSRESDLAQDLVQGVKDGDGEAYSIVADLLARQTFFQFERPTLLVPVPRSDPSKPSNLNLISAWIKKADFRALWGVEVLLRTTKVESSRKMRQQRMAENSNDAATLDTFDMHIETINSAFKSVPPELEHINVVLVDDMLTRGNTMLACYKVLRNAGFLGTITGVAIGYLIEKPELVEWCPFKPMAFEIARTTLGRPLGDKRYIPLLDERFITPSGSNYGPWLVAPADDNDEEEIDVPF